MQKSKESKEWFFAFLISSLTVRKAYGRLPPRTPVSCGHLCQGLRSIKKRMVTGPLQVNLHRPLTILLLRGFSLKCKKTPRCPILPGSCPPSTFSAEGLYFCVRYVNRCFPFAIITRSILRFYSVFGHSKQHKGKEFFKMSWWDQDLGRLVLVSSIHCCTSTSSLSTWSSSRGLTSFEWDILS